MPIQPATLPRRFGRAMAGIFVALLIALSVGAIYERFARHDVGVKFPAPGRLVDIGGRRIHLDCRGVGSPIVVFESGLDTYGSLSWSAVQPAVSKFTRACSYDRAGVMWSDPSTNERDGEAVASDLYKALTVAGEKPPYILVGHSLGGPYSMIFTKRYGPDVAGLVFVDAAHPDQWDRFKAAFGRAPVAMSASERWRARLAWTGLPRLLWPPDDDPKAPEQIHRIAVPYAPPSTVAMLEEGEALDTTFREAGSFRTLGDRPLAVLTAMAPLDAETLAYLKMTKEEGVRQKEVWLALQNDEASWSRQSTHQLLTDSSHYIQFYRPDAVIAAIQTVVNRTREHL